MSSGVLTAPIVVLSYCVVSFMVRMAPYSVKEALRKKLEELGAGSSQCSERCSAPVVVPSYCTVCMVSFVARMAPYSKVELSLLAERDLECVMDRRRRYSYKLGLCT